MTELHYMSATEALRAFRARTLSPVELMEAVIERADKVDRTINALCHRFDERALEQARQAEDRYMGNGEPPRPLEGIPMAVKEEEAVAGDDQREWLTGLGACRMEGDRVGVELCDERPELPRQIGIRGVARGVLGAAGEQRVE